MQALLCVDCQPCCGHPFRPLAGNASKVNPVVNGQKDVSLNYIVYALKRGKERGANDEQQYNTTIEC